MEAGALPPCRPFCNSEQDSTLAPASRRLPGGRPALL